MGNHIRRLSLDQGADGPWRLSGSGADAGRVQTYGEWRAESLENLPERSRLRSEKSCTTGGACVAAVTVSSSRAATPNRDDPATGEEVDLSRRKT
jgi:hypothetical protein